jgi:osmotically-inducible protein OsmY
MRCAVAVKWTVGFPDSNVACPCVASQLRSVPITQNRAGRLNGPVATTQGEKMNEVELQLDVAAELFWDPKVDAERIAVSADNGTVTLRGTVGSFWQKREAAKAARRVHGVTGVRDELQVQILSSDRLEDADLRGDVLQALMFDSLVPTSVDAQVRDGFVTLTGTASWQYQRDEAEFITANVTGVSGIEDEIALALTPSVSDITKDITTAFRRNAGLAADDLCVETGSFGTVILSGVVHSWAEHDDAIAAAWAAPGVTEVDDRILVEY